MKRFLLWDYPRASWQYDVMVGLILAFIFLTPRDLFHDEPRAGSVVMLPTGEFWLEPELLSGLTGDQIQRRATELVRRHDRKQRRVTAVEPVYGAEQQVKGYVAHTTP